MLQPLRKVTILAGIEVRFTVYVYMKLGSITSALTPQQIVEALNNYIVGQKEAKRQVAIALRNRWRSRQAEEPIRSEIIPNNILMIGPTGVGKTEIARRLAHLTEAPFVKVEASKFTEVGYVGRDVESMIRDLMEQSVRIVRQKKKEELRKKVVEAVEHRILDRLVPPTYKKKEDAEDQALNHSTRERFRELLRAGKLDEKKIDLEIMTTQQNPMGMISGSMIDESSLMQLQEMLGGMLPKKHKKRRISIEEARKLLTEEELDKRIDMDEVKEEAILRAQEAGIIFIDEIDKIASHGSSEQPNISQEGVQRDLLPIVEGSTVNTKYGSVHTEHILFIAAGAFHVAKPSDLIPELQGRFPIRIELESLTEEDFFCILSEPRNALTKQYQALMKSDGVSLIFKPGALKKIAHIAYTLNNTLENIGARRLHTVMGTLLSDSMFEIPDEMPKNNILSIGTKEVERALAPLLRDEDMSRYLL